MATAVDTSDNNNITDASTNTHSITVNGDAYAGTFSPYRSGGYSTEFVRSSSERFELSGLSAIGSGDFSIEFWVYTTSDDWMIFCERNGSSNNGFELYKNANNTIRMRIGNTNYDTLTTGTVISKNEWHFVQVVRESNTIKIYIDDNNQSIDASASNSTNLSVTDNFSVGGKSGYSDFVNGYIRDFRISTSARSRAVPSEPLTADSNTLFITCHKPYIIYETPSATGSISVYGTPTVKPFSPYDYIEYAAADNGGSVYFDRASYNSGSCITVADHNDFTLGTSDWTVKFWVYHDELIASSNNAYGYFSNYYYNTPGGFGLKWMNQWGNKPVLEYMNSGSYAKKIFDFVPSEKIWYYYELTCSSSTVTFKVNGDTIGTQSMPDLGNPDRTLIVGASSNGSSGVENFLGGYIADFQYVTGGTASESSVPISPMSTNTNSALHLKGTDASIIDKSQVNNIVMNGPTIGSTTKSAFGSEPTMSFISGSNTNRYLNFDPTVLKFMKILGQPSIPFTIEGIWGWQGSTASPIFEIFQDTNNFFYFGGGPGGTRSGITTDNNLYAIFKIGGVERFKMTAGIGSYNQVGSSFKHQAITRNASGLMQHYYDGQLRSNTITHSGFDTVSWTSPVGYIGRSDWMGVYGRYEGYIHQIRLTVGLARYTANFTPPTASLEG